MADIGATITLQTAEYRACYVNGEKALFHRWTENRQIIEPSAHKGGHSGGVISFTRAIVEFESGNIAEVLPRDICFADNIFDEYAFIPNEARKESKRDEFEMLKKENESITKRISHLLKSDTIRRFDAVDRITSEYKEDVLKFDEEFKKYKEAFEILSECTSCNECKYFPSCGFFGCNDAVAYNCPHFARNKGVEGVKAND